MHVIFRNTIIGLKKREISKEVPGVTPDRRCCSGLDAIFCGVMKIQTDNADIIVAGGMDSMSQAELYVPDHIRWGRAWDCCSL